MERKEVVIPRIGMQIMRAKVHWLKEVGDFVDMREPVIEATSEVGTVSLAGKTTGVIVEITKNDVEVDIGEPVGYIQPAEKEQK